MNITNVWVDSLRAASVVVIKSWLTTRQMHTSERNFENMTRFLMNNLTENNFEKKKISSDDVSMKSCELMIYVHVFFGALREAFLERWDWLKIRRRRVDGVFSLLGSL